jgi:hypothetical protein
VGTHSQRRKKGAAEGRKVGELYTSHMPILTALLVISMTGG